MIQLAKLAFWFWVGYTATTKAAPILQAKIEAMDLDRMWDIWDDSEID